MSGSSKLQLRWIWVSVYIISGCLTATHILFAALGNLPHGFSFAGFGAACFVGAGLAALQSGGASAVESSIAALLVGVLNLAILVFAVKLDGHAPIERISAPLSTTFLCFAGALAGGRVGSRIYRQPLDSRTSLRLAITAVLVLVGATATHFAVLVVVGEFVPALAIILGILLFFTTPAIAGAALQMASRDDVTRAFGVGIVLALLAVIAAVTVHPYGLHNPVKLIILAVSFLVFGAITLLLVIPGVLVAKNTESWLAETTAPLPQAVLRSQRSSK